MRSFAFAAIVASTALGGCASTYSTESITGGFDQTQVNPTTWQVTYYGNGYTTDETVQTYWLYRCAEITLEQGFDGFQIASRIELTQAPAPVVRPAFGEPGGPRELTPIVEYGLTGKPYMAGTIRLLRAPLPDVPGRVFDARALKAFLDPHVNGEKCSGNVCPHVHRYLFPGFVTAPQAS